MIQIAAASSARCVQFPLFGRVRTILGAVQRRSPRIYGFRPPGFTGVTTAHVLRRHGALKLVHGDFGYSLCCWRSTLTRIGPAKFTTVILPYWVRELGRTNSRVRWWGRAKVCRHPCAIDTTAQDVLP